MIGQDDVKTKVLLACGAIAGPLFVVAFLIEGATRADYSPIRHPISSLALGDLGWVQDANFIVTGLLTLALALGLRRALRPFGGSRWGPLLVGLWGIGLLGAGIFVTDPLGGYPPGTPDQPVQASIHGSLHDLLSLLAFVALSVACFVFAARFSRWGRRGWAVYSAVTGVVFTAAFVLSSVGFRQSGGLGAIPGLLQRTSVIVGWAWLTLLAVYLLRIRPERPEAMPTQAANNP